MEECNNCETPRPRLMTVDDGTGARRVCGVCMIAVIAAAERRAFREDRASVVVLLDEAAQAAQLAALDVPPQRGDATADADRDPVRVGR